MADRYGFSGLNPGGYYGTTVGGIFGSAPSVGPTQRDPFGNALPSYNHPWQANGLDAGVRAIADQMSSQLGVGIMSGYRDPGYNASVGGARNSAHTRGFAFDISLSGLTEEQKTAAISYVTSLGVRGVGYYGGDNWHFDWDPSRTDFTTWGPSYTGRDFAPPAYSRQVLNQYEQNPTFRPPSDIPNVETAAGVFPQTGLGFANFANGINLGPGDPEATSSYLGRVIDSVVGMPGVAPAVDQSQIARAALGDFGGTPVQTGIPESEQRANDLMGGVPDFGMIDAATPVSPLEASPTTPVESAPLSNLSDTYSTGGGFGVEQNANLGYGSFSGLAGPLQGPSQPMAGYDPLGSISAPTAPGEQPQGAFGNKDAYDTASDPFSGMMGAPWSAGASGEWGGIPNGSFGVSDAWAAPDTNYSWSGPLADRVTYTAPSMAPAVGDYSYDPTAGYQGGVSPGPQGSTYSGYGDFNAVGGWQGPSPQDYTGDQGFHNVTPQGYTAPTRIDPYGFSGLDAGVGTPGSFLSGSPYGVSPQVNVNGNGWPDAWAGSTDVSGGYSGGTGYGFGAGITPTASAYAEPQSYGGLPNVSVPSVPDAQTSVQASTARPATTYQTVVQKTLNPEWSAYQASLAEQPATPTLGMDFGAVPSMVGNLGYVSDLGATNVTPQKTAPPKYITQKVQVPIEAPQSFASKPKAVKVKQQVLDDQLAFGSVPAAKWARDTTQAATDSRLASRLEAGYPIVDPLTGQTLIDPKAFNVSPSSVVPGVTYTKPAQLQDLGSSGGSTGGLAGMMGMGRYGATADQVAAAQMAGNFGYGPLGPGRGWNGTGFTINDLAANYYNGGLGGGVQVGGSNWAGNQGGLGGGWMNGSGGTANGLNGNHGGFNGTGGLY